MSGSRKRRTTLELGHDAFLDIVANLVGILIILVVVLGTQSKQVIEEIHRTETETPRASETQLASLSRLTARAAAAQADSDRFEQRIHEYDQRIRQRRRQRAVMLDLLGQAEATWQRKKEELDRQAVKAAQRESEAQQLEEHLDRLRGQRQRLENREAPVVAVAHLPTPMAKTVFGDEVHFRLKDNRLSVVPIEGLLEQIRGDLMRMATSSRNGQVDAAVGPVQGYVARYAMNKNPELVRRGGKVSMATRVQVVAMIIEPLRSPHGQPIAEVLDGGSLLDVELAGRDAESTTVTVWVYPDSFAAFRKLKEHLYARGFATAARPLPEGHPIMASPNGSRSDAQ